MSTTARMLLAALLATSTVDAAEGLQSVGSGSSPPPQLASLPVGWSLMGNGGPLALPGSCEIGVDREKSLPEKQQYSIRCTNNVLPSFGGARQTIADAARFRGKRVRVSAWLMATGIESVANAQYPGATGEGGLWLAVGSARKGQRTDRMPDRTLKGSTGWEYRDFVADIPADNDLLQVGYWMQGKGQIWMRDVMVEEVPDTVAVNFPRNKEREAGPDFTLQAVARADERFLPPPAQWLAMGARGFELCDIGVDAQLLKSGTRNLSIACSVPQSAVLRQVPEALPWWGKRVRFSAMIKTQNLDPLSGGGQDGGVTMYLSATATNSPNLTARVTGNSDWQYREIVMDIPRGSAYLPLGFSLTGSGQMWARDLKFEEVSRDTPVTPPGR
jgi:hypothetical protein